MREQRPGGFDLLLVVAVVAIALVGPLPSGRSSELAAAARPSHREGDGRAADRAVAFALGQVGKPYRWGASGPHRYDCSGLTMAAWRHAGVAIPRTAEGQRAGLPAAAQELRPGDLLIYRTNGPSRRHVAMFVGGDEMVEARSRATGVITSVVRGGAIGIVRPGGR